MKPKRPPTFVLIHVRVPRALLQVVDAYGAELTMTRSATLRYLLMSSLTRLGRWPPGPDTGSTAEGQRDE